MNLSVEFCGLKFSNPTVLASGYLGVTGASLANCANNGAGAVTSKTLFMEECLGNPNPSILTFPGGIINAVGLSGEGIKNAKGEFEKYKELAEDGNPIIGSIGGKNLDELIEVARIMDEYPIDMLELNFSCLNIEGEMGMPISYDHRLTAEATKAIRKVVKKPISVKLSPNAHDISLVAKYAEDEGADAITAVNTMGPGMLIDVNMRRPVLANITGGVSGQALKPIALRCVWDIYKAVKIPIIATGGIIRGNDAIEMLMAGGSLLGLGSVIAAYDMKAFNMITEKISIFMEKEGFTNISELVGLAHKTS